MDGGWCLSGDLADRGPDSPAVVSLVSRLMDHGRAQCVLGNHELNLLRHGRKDGNGWYFAANHDQEETGLIRGVRSHHWLGAMRNVFCVDFAVGARYKERLQANGQGFECRLAAVRWPEQQLLFDN